MPIRTKDIGSLRDKDIQRFESFFSRGSASQCWEWTGTIHPCGYGVLCVCRDGKPRDLRAHRIAWSLENGPIPEGKIICHSCDNRRCVNPAHLRADTAAGNQRDAANRNRMPHGEGHPATTLTEAQVLAIRSSSGFSQSQLARQYGVSQQTIGRILGGKSWIKSAYLESKEPARG